jgi:hypothetical protein
MASAEQASTWYELRTKRGNTIVLRDTELPAANKGRIYLFNTDRGAIVEYDETIVSDKLFPISEQQQEQAESEFGKTWKEQRFQFLKAHGKRSPITPDEPEPSNDELLKQESEVDEESADFEDEDLEDE